MIRQPTSARAAYAWHIAVMAGDAPAVHDGWPECGWYRARLVRGGPWVAVQLRISRPTDDEGELTGPEAITGEANGNHLTSPEIDALWLHLEPISREAFQALSTRIAATPSMHDPYKKINIMSGGTI